MSEKQAVECLFGWTIKYPSIYWRIVQLVERLTVTQEVAGSRPAMPATLITVLRITERSYVLVVG